MTRRYVVTPCLLIVCVCASLAADSGLTWREGTPMPTPVGGHCVALTGPQVLCAGGTTWQGGTKRWLREVSVYDLPADRWQGVGRLPEPVGHAVGIGTGDSLCVISGSDGRRASEEGAGPGGAVGFTADVLRYDPAARTYSLAGTLPVATACAAPVRQGSKLLLFGGEPVMKQRGAWVWLADLPPGH
jgi:hypothetical protein